MAKQSKPSAEAPPGYQEIEKEVTFICPKRGRVTQKIKVKVYPTAGTPTTQVCH